MRTTCTNPKPLEFGISNPLIFRVCTFLVNVLSNMYDQWKSANPPFPPPDQFKWRPVNACPVTNDFKVTDYDFGQLIWSTFTYKDDQGDEQTATEPFGSLVKSKADLYLVFRGTKSAADVGADKETFLVPYGLIPSNAPTDNPGARKVGKGWYAVYNGLARALYTQLKPYGPGQKIIVTGHSLGSALATLAVPDLVANKFEVRNYNSGSPKVGNESFRTFYESLFTETFRLVNTADTVPTLPENPEYVHVGTQVSFNADYGVEVKPHNEKKTHNPCCSYAYAIYNRNKPCNPTFDACNVPPN
jgi:triacylglycerol lipase